MAVVGCAFCLGSGVWFLETRLRTHHPPADQVRTALRAIARDQMLELARSGRLAERPEAGFTPHSRGYAYVFARDVFVVDRWVDGGAELERRLVAIPPDTLASCGISVVDDGGTALTVLAAGDLDADPTVDVWSVSTADRTVNGQLVPAGEPFRHVDDFED